MGSLRASINAGSATDAKIGVIRYFGLRVLGFGAVTPSASERTALEEDGGSDTWSVVDCEVFYVKYNALDTR
ncbi:MAG: hypothetical protein PVH79_02820 [Candidatus Bathyarchaeota archaeon]